MDREQNGRNEATSLKILLIGSREEDYFIIHDLLRASSDFGAASLDQAHTFAEAQTKLAPPLTTSSSSSMSHRRAKLCRSFSY